MVRGRSFCLHAFLGVLLPTILVHSQLHQMHLMRTTCSTVPPQGMNNQRTLNHFFSHALCPTEARCEGPLVDCLIKEPPLSALFSVLRIVWTVVVPDRRHTGPVKNGDAFERLAL